MKYEFDEVKSFLSSKDSRSLSMNNIIEDDENNVLEDLPFDGTDGRPLFDRIELPNETVVGINFEPDSPTDDEPEVGLNNELQQEEDALIVNDFPRGELSTFMGLWKRVTNQEDFLCIFYIIFECIYFYFYLKMIQYAFEFL